MAHISRRSLIAAIPPLFVVKMGEATTIQPIVGAIRWDAWYSKQDDSVYAQNNLAPKIYQRRSPIHCSFHGDQISCNGNLSVIDAEIRAASRAGIAFWAFDWFPSNSSLRRAWELYQSSQINHLIKWCPIVGLGELGSPSFSNTERDRKLESWVTRMSSSTYYKVDILGDKRPLIFIFYRSNELLTYFGTLKALHSCLDRLRELATIPNIGNPYIVIFDPALDMKLFKESGADALSNYIGAFQPRERGTFADLDRQVRRYWDRMAATGVGMIPIAQVGWDTRPRHDHPVPWDKPKDSGGQTRDNYYAIATPQEFFEHMKATRDFVERNQLACPSHIILLYSWDECDEGGCIMPTFGDPNGAYLSALSAALSGRNKWP
jgi:hypothetical protein